MTDTNNQSDTPITSALCHAIGGYSVQCSETKELALPIYLVIVLDQVRELESALSAERAKNATARDEALEMAFIQGAKWHEYVTTGATMWQSDQDRAAFEAKRMREFGGLGMHCVERAMKGTP